MKTILSICIVAYNQYQLVKKNLDEITKYSGQNVEIVISDDCSDDDLERLVDSYKDPRIKYTRTAYNMGHDLNIIHALKNCSSSFAMILRSRDMILSTSIQRLVKIINRNKKSAYILFSAVDEDNEPKMILSDKRYCKGIEAIRASTKLLIHPSGQIYNLKKLNLDIIERHIINSFQDKFGFEAHNLIRMQLAEKGDFLTFSLVGWVYTNTSNAKDIAQNSSDKGISVYAPYYEYKRYTCEFKYVAKNVFSKYKNILYWTIIKRFYKSIIVDFDYQNNDKASQAHYNYKAIEFSKKEEWKNFMKHSNRLFECEPQRKYILRTYLYVIRLMSVQFILSSWCYRHFGKKGWFIYLYKKIKGI